MDTAEKARNTTMLDLICSEEELEELRDIARSTTFCIWSIKRAKVILGHTQGKTGDRLVKEVRVPPRSIAKCLETFAKTRMDYFRAPERKPTSREAAVEKMLRFLRAPPHSSSVEWDNLSLKYIGRYFSAREIRRMRELIASNPSATRKGMAQQVCEEFGIIQANGSLKAATVVDILKRMDMDNIVTLPPLPPRKSEKHAKAVETVPEPSDHEHEECRRIDWIQIVPITTLPESHLWNQMIQQYHYIKTYRLFGPRVRYLVYGGQGSFPSETHPGEQEDLPIEVPRPFSSPRDTRSRDRAGPGPEQLVAVLGFSPCAWRLSTRDHFIGWSDEQRIANIRLVICNSRFLILPWIKAPNLASRILGGVTRRLPGDWEARYAYRPALIETFVQIDRFKGTCYKAANWIQVGATNGYSLYGESQKAAVPTKAIFLYPLRKDYRQVLCGAHCRNE
jgi:hypothetical protein